MDYAKLRQLIDSDPANAARTDAEVLAWLTTPSITKAMPYEATTRTLMADLGPALADSILKKLEAAAASNSVVARALKLLDPAQGGLDLAHAATRAQLQALVSAGVLAQSDYDALVALSDRTVSPAEDVGLSAVRLGDVIEARSGRY